MYIGSPPPSIGGVSGGATGEYKYAVNQHAKSFHDRPSKEFF
jgi:hypothetical protein